MGTVVKPTVGMLDIAEGVSTGLSNSASVFEVGEADAVQLKRFRPTRPPSLSAKTGNALYEDGCQPLQLYDRATAYAFSLLEKDEKYLHHGESGSILF